MREGLLEGKRVAVADLCDLHDIALTNERRAMLDRLDEDKLRALKNRLKRERRWPA